MSAPVDRHAARVLCLDPADRVLLVQSVLSRDPGEPVFWITPGGALEPGESAADAARRELDEETGLRPEALVGPLHRREVVFDFRGVTYRQHEQFFAARVDTDPPLSSAGWTDVERELTLDVAWWETDRLRATTETVYPDDIAELVASAASLLGPGTAAAGDGGDSS